MGRETREIVIGAVTVLALVAVLVFMNARSGQIATSDSNLLLTAKFNKVDGLATGADVRMGGIAIGKVTGMKLDSQFRAVISMHVDGPIDLPKDSSASIHTDGLFGSKFVVLEPGAEDGGLKSGDDVTFTQDAVVVSDLLELIISEGKSNRAGADSPGKANSAKAN
jgi:phospholipid/cholesterol/gamma-HCH transport system substrate-binding protein